MLDLFGQCPVNSDLDLRSFGSYMMDDFSFGDTRELLKEPELKEVLICPHTLKANDKAVKGLLAMSEQEFEDMQSLFSSNKMLDLIMNELQDKSEIELFRVIHRLFSV